MNVETKYDLLTGEAFVPGRVTQRFATRANAIKYNNLKAKEQREALRYIQDPVKKNLKFLSDQLATVNEKQFTVEYLNGAGYDLNMITHFRKRGEVAYPCLYNFMMIKVDETKIKFEKYD
jgi:hypothetical protein